MGSAKRTSTSELNEAGEQLLGFFYRGAWPAGMEPPPDGSNHVVIYNTKDRPPGEHWLCEYREGDTRLLYDSFGRIPSTQWQPRLHGCLSPAQCHRWLQCAGAFRPVFEFGAPFWGFGCFFGGRSGLIPDI